MTTLIKGDDTKNVSNEDNIKILIADGWRALKEVKEEKIAKSIKSSN